MAKIVQISDLHIARQGELLIGHDPRAALDRCIKHILDHHSDADRLIISGDLCHRGESESYIWLRRQLDRLPMPVIMTIGNHDDRQAFRTVFSDYPVDDNGFIQSTDNVGGYRIITIDTNIPGAHPGELCPQRFAWLEAAIGQATRDDVPVILVMHHHPLPIGLTGFDRIGLQNPEPFHALLAANRTTIRQIVFGHCHMTLSGNVAGVAFCAPRSVNHQSWPDFSNSGQLTFANLQPGYNVLLTGLDGVVVHTVEFDFDGPVTRVDTTFDQS